MIAIERWRPFGSVATWDSEVNRLFDGFFGRPAASNGERMWVPALDMYETKGESYHHVERVFGKFERSVQLPMEVQADKVQATYRDGMLEVKLPKAEEVKPREI